ncbi:MAG: ABC transporter ATP-binding protein [Bacteroidales bacterium]|jgi:iron complex transport system ATP-binding protein|nr:ABC transporter ATP-binding protein [Bacteroidales bacterium]
MDYTDNILDIRDLTIGYLNDDKVVTIQSDLNLQLKKGELCCLIGPNGVGKSTLLRSISTQLSKLKGEILLNGISINDYDNQTLAKTLSVVLTESVQVPNLKVNELVAMGRFPYTNFWGKLNNEDQEKIDESIHLVGLQTLAERNFIELSDGEKQKALIAKALAQDTALILLDEPTAFLDFPSKMAILAELRKIAHSRNVAIILSTHDLELALKMADKIWLFPNKNEFKTGIPEDLVLSGAISNAFSNELLSFDLKTAHFTQRIKTRDILNVEGNSIEVEWLKRALIRKGISANPNNNMMFKALYDGSNNKYILQNENDIIGIFDNINEILKKIENIN